MGFRAQIAQKIVGAPDGVEPMNTGFADAPYSLFTNTYANYTTLENPEKYAKKSSQWC
jgi:hypothetical protein